MSNLFYLNSNPELKGKTAGNAIVNNISVDEKMAPLPEPITNGLINVTKDFKWTKTIRNDINVSQIPTLSLTEYYITQPAFLSNIRNVYSVLPRAASGFANSVANAIPGSKDFINSIKESIGNLENSDFIQDSVVENLKNPLVTGVKGMAKSAMDGIAVMGSGIDVGSAAYMKAYEDIYGVLKSNFRYRIPYFSKNWKSITTKFEGGTFNDTGNSNSDNPVEQFMSLAAVPYQFANTLGDKLTTGFAMDFAKSYQYGSDGPSARINFFWDNTYDSFTDK